MSTGPDPGRPSGIFEALSRGTGQKETERCSGAVPGRGPVPVCRLWGLRDRCRFDAIMLVRKYDCAASRSQKLKPTHCQIRDQAQGEDRLKKARKYLEIH
jgi:hypothetical protein